MGPLSGWWSQGASTSKGMSDCLDPPSVPRAWGLYCPLSFWRSEAEASLLPRPTTPPTAVRPSRLLRSRLALCFPLALAIYLVVLVDRTYIRDLSSSQAASCSTSHFANAVAARACASLPTSAAGFRNTFCSHFEQKEREQTQANELNSLRTQSATPESVSAGQGEFGIELDRSLSAERCEKTFPNLYPELDRAIAFYGTRGNVTVAQLDQAIKQGHARVLIYHNRVYIKQFNGGPGKRTEAILNSIQEAVITSPEILPNVEFVVKTIDAPQTDDAQHPLWVLDRKSAQQEVWLMPDYGFYSWPEPKVGGMIEVRDKCAQVEANLTWSEKIPKAFWRGAILVKLREQMIEIAKGHEWNDIKPLEWRHLDGLLKTPADHCRYKYVVHAEGYAYSGRLKYLQMCRSVVVAHNMQYIQHFHHLLDGNPQSPTQNIALTPGPGFEGLPQLMDNLIKDDARAELIANNSVRLFRHYLSPAGVTCYWRQMFRSWARVQGFEPVRLQDDTAFESFNLMHITHWNPY